MVSCNGVPRPQIPQFFAGRSVFITGATGFMGKVLVERLLWTCPGIDRLHLLMRSKKDVLPEKRLEQLKDSQVFDNIKASCPERLDKLGVVSGDITQPKLGLDQESITELKDVSVVFHSAATLKFDEALPTAVQQNVLSVVRMMELCDSLPNIQAFIYVSTAYSNAERTVVEERVYPPPVPLDQLLSLADCLPANLVSDITPKYIYPKPNTYTFTKAMAEVAVSEHGCKAYPIAIFRPTIVISSAQHPFPGWVENLNGPSGVLVGAGKGLLHVFRCKRAARADMLPVDHAIDALIAVAWETAVDKMQEVRVYNCTTIENPTTWFDFETGLRENLRDYPFDGVLWYPSGGIIENGYAQRFCEFFSQTAPLHLAEYACRIFGIKTRLNLITVSNRLQAMNAVLTFFSQREWDFQNVNIQKLRQRLSPQDAAIYKFDPKTINWSEHYKNFVKGTRKYLLKEKDENMPTAKRHLSNMRYVHYGAVIFTFLLIFRLALKNNFIQEFVYGIIGLLYSLCSIVISRVPVA